MEPKNEIEEVAEPYCFKFGRTKYLLTKIGEHAPVTAMHFLDACVNYLCAGHWVRSHGYHLAKRFRGYTQLFELAAKEVGNSVTLYLEFGVYRGASMRTWSRLLRNPNSQLHGFDSFEGLPEAWRMAGKVGEFNVDGQLPVVDDPRVRFFKGWFEDTLPQYVPPKHECLVINVDCDVYSSTKTIFRNLKEHIKPGTYIYFDEFNNREHELKAWDEFLAALEMKFELVGADITLSHVMFRRVA